MSDHRAADPAPETGPLLAVLLGRGAAGGRHTLRRPVATIGRGPGNDLVLGDPSVSERHAALRLSDGVWTLRDLGSVNGTWLDGEPVQDELPLASGCSVRLGAVELVFAAHDRWEDSPPRPVRRSGERPGYLLATPSSSATIPMAVWVAVGLAVLALAGFLLSRAA